MRHGSLWLDSAPALAANCDVLPARTDVAIVGGGYTGLAAAHALAGSGVSVLVIEQQEIGGGASSRNGGFVLPGFKQDLAHLCGKLGRDTAAALHRESLDAIAFLERVVADEHIDCDFRRSGHITLAESSSQLRALEGCSRLLTSMDQETEILDSRTIRSEVASERYQGGLLDPVAAQVQPARLLVGLAKAAMQRGAQLIEGTRVDRIKASGNRSVLETTRGIVEADVLVVATNGYSGPAHPTFRRRIVPIGSHIIATRPLSADLRASLLPRGRAVNDSRNLLHYYRMSPDGRLVFGGRASFTPTSPLRTATILQRDMLQIFPQLAGTDIEYAWSGNVGFTRDQMPHLQLLNGAWCVGGFCGHGVAMSLYLGDRLGQHIATNAPLPRLAMLDFPRIPLYNGEPWFLPLAGGWYRLKDWISSPY